MRGSVFPGFFLILKFQLKCLFLWILFPRREIQQSCPWKSPDIEDLLGWAGSPGWDTSPPWCQHSPLKLGLTSTSHSYSEASSRVTLQRALFTFLVVFWGDFWVLLGVVLSESPSVSL